MKKLSACLLLLLVWIAAGCDGKRHDSQSAVRTAGVRTFSSFDPLSSAEQVTAAHGVKFVETDLAQVLDAYAAISRRSIIRAGNVPNVKITFSNETPMSTVELLQALD